MKNKKLIFTWLGAIILILLAIVFSIHGFINKIFDPVLWGTWFTAFSAVISVYNITNVQQKKVISENYHPELEGK